jgi:putative endonuclease
MKARGPRERKKAHGLGIFAERAAVLNLRLKGYRILACRYRVQGGEIDIVARRGDTIAFVEVKVRPTLDEARTSSNVAASPARRKPGSLLGWRR